MSSILTSTTSVPLNCLFVAVFLLAFSAAWADEYTVIRCMYQVGEFGNEMLQICAEADASAQKALSKYPEESKEVVARCSQNVEEIGWVMVKRCVDNHVAAESALVKYAQEHGQLVQKCTAKAGAYGPARVKACVDEEVGAEQSVGRGAQVKQ